MSTRTLALKFVVQGGIVYAVDQHLHKLAIEFAQKFLAAEINFSDYENVLCACELDENDVPIRVTGVNCRVVRYDYPVWRFITEEAGDALIERTRAALDEQGLRGAEVFIHVADHEDPESRCPRWKKFLKKVRAEKASRWRVKA